MSTKLKADFDADYKRSREYRTQVRDGDRPDSDMPFETCEAFMGVSTSLRALHHAEQMLERALTRLQSATGIDYTA